MGAAIIAGLAAVPQAQAASGRRAIPAAGPKVTQGAADRGAVKRTRDVTLRVYLAPRGGEAALKAAVAAVSDPASASYHHYLTPAQFSARYRPTAKAVRAVSGFLRSGGLKVTGLEPSGRYLTATGDAAAAEKAFATTLHTFSKGGSRFRAPTRGASVPGAVAGKVLAVSGLSTARHQMRPHATFPDAFVNARPCSQYYGQVPATYKADFKTPLPKFKGETLPYAPCGYVGSQYRSAYTNDTALNGAGTSVAITDAYAAPTIAKDAQKYATNHGDGGYATGQLVQSVPSKFTHQALCDPSGWYGEETLDVEAVHAMAPKAHILYYGAASCLDADFLTTLAQVVDDDQASLVSNSWGDLEENSTSEGVAAYEQVFLQGAMQGIGFLFSSGDNGDELANSGRKQADYPTSDPYVTSVGGTSDAIGQDGSFLFQTGWGTEKWSLSTDQKSWTDAGYLYGAGGGNSSLFNRPDYQNGVVPTKYGSGRAVPDMAMDADPTTGMLVGETQTFSDGKAYGEYRIGGTSLASPLFAGMTALRTQQAGGRLGFLNPSIYANAGSTAFKDVKGAPKDAGNVRVDYANAEDAADGLLYSVRTFNQDSTLSLAKGWDQVTGIGSPTPAWLTAPTH
jgi:subtilase family serine protease